MEEAKTTKVSKELKLPGYVVDQDLLRRVDELEVEAICATEEDKTGVPPRYVLSRRRDVLEFKSMAVLIADLNREPRDVRSLAIRRTLRRRAGIDVVFSNDGAIRISGFSNSSDFQFNVARLSELLLTSAEERAWAIRTIVFLPPKHRVLLATLLVLLSFFLLTSVGYYLYAIKIGVNIDPSLIPRGNEHLQKVADALKSTDINQKLNALLLAQLGGFQNVRDVLANTRRNIIVELSGILTLTALLFARKILGRLYPAAFFLFGHNQKIYSSLQTKRQVWGVAVLVGFIVNVAAGLAVALLLR
jgi:hypothetical protein